MTSTTTDSANDPVDIVAMVDALEPTPGVPFSDQTRKYVLDATNDPEEELRGAVADLAMSDQAIDATRRALMVKVLEDLEFDHYRDIQSELLVPDSILAHMWRMKYLNLMPWLRAKLDVAIRLGLHEGPPLSILDIGVGPGHFPYVCRLYGHEVVGTDVLPLPLGPEWDGPHVYDCLIELFGLDRRPLTVSPLEPLPDFGQRFDMVTALMVKFDSPVGGPAWGPGEWDFFLNDLANNVLAQGGRAFFQLNRPFAGPRIMDFMTDRGAETDQRRCTVRFEDMTRFIR